MNESIDFWSEVTKADGTKLTNEEKLQFCENLNQMLRTSPELAKIFFNTQVYNEIINDVTTRGLHSEGVAIVGENLAIKKAKLDGKSDIEQKISGLITKALGYMHDLGHTPFGHDGEGALNNEMERFEATSDYKAKREKLFGREYTLQAGDLDAEVMCYEHNETSAIIAQGLLEKFSKENDYIIGSNSMQYMKTGILAHSTSRVKEEPKGIEQKAVRLADKVAYIPQDLLDLIKQGVLKIDDLTPDEQGLLGLDEQQLTVKEIEEYKALVEEEDKQKYAQSRKEIKASLKERLRNIDKMPEPLKMKLFRNLDDKVAEMQAEIAQKCFVKSKSGEIKLDGRKSKVDFYDNAVNKGKIPKDHEITLVEMEGIKLFKALRDAQRLPTNSQEEIQTRKIAVDEASKNYTQFLSTQEHINPTMATLWVTKAKYQDAFIKGDLSKIYETKDGQVQKETLADINKRNENGWKMKATFQYFYSNIEQIPQEFRDKYKNGEESLYTEQQIVSAFIASFTNNGLDELYNGLLDRNLVISRQEAIKQLQMHRPDLDIESIVSNDKKWTDPQNPEAKHKVAANDVLEYLYEENVGNPIVNGKDKIIDRAPIPKIQHYIAVRDGVEDTRDKSMEISQDNSELLMSALDVSKEQVNSKDIQAMVASIRDKQNTQEIQAHIDEVNKLDESR